MKTLLHSIVATTFVASSAFAQKAGDAVTPDSLGKAEWITGTAPAAWEPGKLYILECWATWCGPCIAAIPHVDALYDKYQERGLRVIGMNVWEDGKDKVADFVKNKGEGMSYPVAYVGKGGDFENTWLKPAEVRGIPHAFVVKDGKVLLTTHPMQLTDEAIEGLLAGGEAEAKVLADIDAKQKAQEALSATMRDFRQAAGKSDIEAMEKALSALKELDAAERYLPSLVLEMHLAKKDWDAAESQLASLKDDPSTLMPLYTTATRLLRNPDSPESFRRSVAGRLEKQLEKNGQVTFHHTLSKLQWSLGEKDAAVASAKRAVESLKASATAARAIPAAPFEKYLESLENGEMPSDEAFNGWLRDAMSARTPTPAAPKDG